MLVKSLLSFAILLTLSPLCRAQSAAKTTAPEQSAPEQSAAAAAAALAAVYCDEAELLEQVEKKNAPR